MQQYLDERVAYNKEPDGVMCQSPRLVMRSGVGHCMEGALLAAAALEFHGDPPLLVDLEATNDDDHVLAVYRRHGLWGAVAQSNYSGLRLREPVYRTLRELAMSYFEHYFNPRGQKTLRGFSRTVDLRRFRRDWRTAEEHVWFVPEHLCEIPHTPLLTPTVARALGRMDRRLLEAGRLGCTE